MRRNKQSSPTTSGTCKLTRQTGRFVDSHILPQALTRPSKPGSALYQYGHGDRPTRRWTSWYDSQLVTAEGERILAELDTWAIDVLREHRLVWSGWGTAEKLGSRHTSIGSFLGIRSVNGLDTARLRRFFHSLLWRASASGRFEFAEIAVPDEDLEVLRREVIGIEDPPIDFYPIQLTQLSTKGMVHNQTPIADTKFLPNLLIPGGAPFPVPTFRFYFDGLIAHMYRALPKGYTVTGMGNLIVGAANDIVLSTVTFEQSLQGANMLDVLSAYGNTGDET